MPSLPAKSVNEMTDVQIRHYNKIVEYLANPGNDWPKKGNYHKILGITRGAYYNHFTPEVIAQMESDALTKRRARLGSLSHDVDKAVYNKAVSGDIQAAQLWYKRIERWGEDQMPSGKLVIAWQSANTDTGNDSDT